MGRRISGRVEKLKLIYQGLIFSLSHPTRPCPACSMRGSSMPCLQHARLRVSWRGSPNVKRLFGNYWEAEEEYFRRTGIFPIMHTVIIKRSVYEQNPWVAMSLFKACLASKDIALRNLQHTYALYASLPWLVHQVDYTRKIMGDDWWPYGIEKNRKTIEALCQYSFEQSLSVRRMTIEDLFAPETFDDIQDLISTVDALMR